jgi:hypothetical protein
MATTDKDFLVKNGLQVTDNASVGGNVTITGNLTVSGTSNIGGGSSYSDSDVDNHLNQSNPTSGYVLSWNGSDYAWVAQSGGGGGISLTDLSVTTNSAGTAALSYNDSTGVFSYTPPDLSSYVTSSSLTTTLSSYATTASLATVATTGSYSDLSGTPSLATVATTGDYDDLTNKPTITVVNVTSLPGTPDSNTLYVVTSS